VDTALTNRHGESAAHVRLKRLALLWAQGQGYSACAVEMRLPRCRYRVDVAAYRPEPTGSGATAVFECKQERSDLRRDNCSSSATRARLQAVYRRRQILEKHLRVHYPSLRVADSLFAEFDSYDFAAIGHRNYGRVLRELNALQNQLSDCTKFEVLFRYRCANLFFLVLPGALLQKAEIPFGWGALVESDDALSLMCKPLWQQTSPEHGIQFLQRIAAAGARRLNRDFTITFEEVLSTRSRAGL
jgi:hypothetical protein